MNDPAPKAAQVAGLPVAGYKPTQSQAAIDQVSEFKRDEERLLRKLDALDEASTADPGSVDPYWLAVGRERMQEAFMFINRSIFQPGRVTLPEDAA